MKHLPNLLSAARLALAPYIFHLLSTNQYRSALIWFAVAGVTDGLDGWLARQFNAGSRLGAYLDPVADKVLLSGSFLVLALNGVVPWSLTVMVLGRDLVILGFAVGVLLFTKTRRDFPPSIWGKISTAAQIVYVLLATAFGAGYLGPLLVFVMGWATFSLTAWSGVDYARRARE